MSSDSAASKKDLVKEFFGQNAPAYATGYRKTTPDLPRLLELLHLQPDWQAVDIGAGTGRITAAVAPFVQHVTAIDLTPAMESEFRQTMQVNGVQNVHFILGDAENLPLPSAQFHVVTCARAAHHFPDINRAIWEMARVLRPGGVLGLIDMTTPDTPAAAQFLNALEQMRDASHVRALSPQEWRVALTQGGFSVESCEVQTELLGFADWFAPVPANGAAAQQARALAAATPLNVREQVFPSWEPELQFLKQRIIAVARKR